MSQAGRHYTRVPLQIRTPQDRQKVEDTVETLISLLDATDGDADDNQLDPADPPPYLGLGDEDDREPELGWTNDVNQEQASRNLRLTAVQYSNNGETEHDGREPGADDEPRCTPFALNQDAAP